MNVKILVVDDDKQTASSIGRYLNSCGYSADYECNPLQALKKIEDDNFLIVISDIVMKPMSGIDLLRNIKEYNGMIQVIMITGYVDQNSILSCMRLGASYCFFKPIDNLEELTEAVNKCIGRLNYWQDIMKKIKTIKS